MLKNNPAILIVLMGSLGDLVRGLCIVTPLKNRFPRGRLTWLVEPAWKDLVCLHPGIDSVIVFNRAEPLKGLVQLRKDFIRNHFDITIDLQRHLKSGFFSLLSGAGRRIGFHRYNAKEFNWVFHNEHIDYYSETLPKIQHYLKFLEILKIPVPASLDFGFSNFDAGPHLPEMVRELTGPFVAIVMGSSWENKNWHFDGYKMLAEDIVARRKLPVVLLGDKSKTDQAAELVKTIDRKEVINLTGRTTLTQLLAILKSSAAAVGPDSGPGHMSAAVNTPYVTLFGPTPPQRVVPYKCEDFIVQSEKHCVPCYKKKCGADGLSCMHQLNFEKLTKKLDLALSCSI